jgi:tetratricopeptide (TPR) repeat protein
MPSSGELAMRPLPAVLLDLHEQFATGKLTLKRGRLSKTVDLVNGNPVSTASTPRDETLGHFLVNSGVISEDEHRQAVARASEVGGKLGEQLVALRVLTVEQLVDQLGRQARHKLVQALRWPQGAWQFEEADPIEGMQLRMVEVVLVGLRETAVEDLDRLARFDGMSFELTRRGVRLRHELKRVYGEKLVALLGDGAPIEDLERAMVDRVPARIAIDAMIMCDAVEANVGDMGLGPTAGSTLPDLKLPIPEPVPPPVKSRTVSVKLSAGPALFDMLFDDIGLEADGAAPLEMPEEENSGVISLTDVNAAGQGRDAIARARQTLTAEHQRVQGADHYAVLMINRRSTAQEIDTAAAVRTNLVEHQVGVLADPRDLARAAELRQLYATARSVLLDDRKRAAYDRELAGGELVQVPPAIDTELNFRVAEELIGKQQWAQAINLIKTVIARSPNEADYHAALGWAEWNAGERHAEAADRARPHLNAALEINPDHAAAHDYKGRIDAGLRSDDAEALFHLERALDLDPNRVEAIGAIETLLAARGELRRYERILKRLLFRLRGRGNAAEAKAWAKLSRLYVEHLDDPQAGAAAAANAKRINPRDSDVAALIQRTDPKALGAEPLRAGWREALHDPSSGAALVKTTEASGHADAAFLAASTMVGLGTADEQMAGLYEKDRVRSVSIPTVPLGREQWALLRHKDDNLELGALIELVAPAVHAVAPMTLADSELDPSQKIDDMDLPASFLRLRGKFSELLGVEPAPVYPKVELGSQIHVVACDPPVLVAGDDALLSPERPDLVFRLVRAMTFLWPGRAVGASRPGRVLRAVVMAVFREASGSMVGADDALAGSAAAALTQLPPPVRLQARSAALRLLSRGGGLNLSTWARSLSRTADRAGMLLCGDIPSAFAGAKDAGDLDKDLVEFAYSAAHVQLRKQLGLARG